MPVRPQALCVDSGVALHDDCVAQRGANVVVIITATFGIKVYEASEVTGTFCIPGTARKT